MNSTKIWSRNANDANSHGQKKVVENEWTRDFDTFLENEKQIDNL